MIDADFPAETVTIDTDVTTVTNLASLAFAWGYDVDLAPTAVTADCELVVEVTGRDAYDFVIRYEENAHS